MIPTTPGTWPVSQDSEAEPLTEAPFWSYYRRHKDFSPDDEELLSVYRDYGVIRKADRDDNFNKASEDLSAYQLVQPGDLVINKMKAWQGSVGVSRYRGIVSPAYFVFKRVAPADDAYMHYLLRSQEFAHTFRAASKGIRPQQWDLDPDQLRRVSLHLPGLARQRHIVDYLDRETAEIDAFIADQEKLVELLTERRTAVSAHPFNAIVRDSQREKSVPLGSILREVDVRVGAAQRELFSVSIHRGLLPWSDMHDSPPRADNFDMYKKTERGDVVLNRMRAFQGAAGMATSAGMVSPDYAVLRPNSGAGSEFVEQLIRSSPMIEAMRARLRGIGGEASGAVRTPRINVWDLLRIRVAIPPLAEQHEITSRLADDMAVIDAAIADAREAIVLSKERRAALISAAVTGKIDVREHGRALA